MAMELWYERSMLSQESDDSSLRFSSVDLAKSSGRFCPFSLLSNEKSRRFVRGEQVVLFGEMFGLKDDVC